MRERYVYIGIYPLASPVGCRRPVIFRERPGRVEKWEDRRSGRRRRNQGIETEGWSGWEAEGQERPAAAHGALREGMARREGRDVVGLGGFSCVERVFFFLFFFFFFFFPFDIGNLTILSKQLGNAQPDRGATRNPR